MAFNIKTQSQLFHYFLHMISKEFETLSNHELPNYLGDIGLLYNLQYGLSKYQSTSNNNCTNMVINQQKMMKQVKLKM